MTLKETRKNCSERMWAGNLIYCRLTIKIRESEGTQTRCISYKRCKACNCKKLKACEKSTVRIVKDERLTKAGVVVKDFARKAKHMSKIICPARIEKAICFATNSDPSCVECVRRYKEKKISKKISINNCMVQNANKLSKEENNAKRKRTS